jgi:type I restriction enzyme S subunit
MTDLSVDGDTLGYSALIPENYKDEIYLHNQRVGKIVFKRNISKYFIYYLMKTEDYQWFILSGASGTSIRHTSPTSICSYEFKLPLKQTMDKFENICSDLQNKIRINQTQIRTLTALRDTLLPKLMSGEVKVAI